MSEKMGAAPDQNKTAFILNNGVPADQRPEGLQFKPSVMPPEYFDPDGLMKLDASISREDAEKCIERARKERVYRSRDWQVHIQLVAGTDGWPALLHLNCRRTDREPCHDWRELQMIKNILVGPEHEAVELYPAESRLTDTANNYHLWVILKSGLRFPFGFNGRAVFAAEDAAKYGAKQR